MSSANPSLGPLTATQKRVAKVLERMREAALDSDDDAQMFAELLEAGLTELHGEDAFGSEGQCDPRGDFRDGTWSMSHVQGLDG